MAYIYRTKGLPRRRLSNHQLHNKISASSTATNKTLLRQQRQLASSLVIACNDITANLGGTSTPQRMLTRRNAAAAAAGGVPLFANHQYHRESIRFIDDDDDYDEEYVDSRKIISKKVSSPTSLLPATSQCRNHSRNKNRRSFAFSSNGGGSDGSGGGRSLLSAFKERLRQQAAVDGAAAMKLNHQHRRFISTSSMSIEVGGGGRQQQQLRKFTPEQQQQNRHQQHSAKASQQQPPKITSGGVCNTHVNYSNLLHCPEYLDGVADTADSTGGGAGELHWSNSINIGIPLDNRLLATSSLRSSSSSGDGGDNSSSSSLHATPLHSPPPQLPHVANGGVGSSYFRGFIIGGDEDGEEDGNEESCAVDDDIDDQYVAVGSKSTSATSSAMHATLPSVVENSLSNADAEADDHYMRDNDYNDVVVDGASSPDDVSIIHGIDNSEATTATTMLLLSSSSGRQCHEQHRFDDNDRSSAIEISSARATTTMPAVTSEIDTRLVVVEDRRLSKKEKRKRRYSNYNRERRAKKARLVAERAAQEQQQLQEQAAAAAAAALALLSMGGGEYGVLGMPSLSSQAVSASNFSNNLETHAIKSQEQQNDSLPEVISLRSGRQIKPTHPYITGRYQKRFDPEKRNELQQQHHQLQSAFAIQCVSSRKSLQCNNFSESTTTAANVRNSQGLVTADEIIMQSSMLTLQEPQLNRHHNEQAMLSVDAFCDAVNANEDQETCAEFLDTLLLPEPLDFEIIGEVDLEEVPETLPTLPEEPPPAPESCNDNLPSTGTKKEAHEPVQSAETDPTPPLLTETIPQVLPEPVAEPAHEPLPLPPSSPSPPLPPKSPSVHSCEELEVVREYRLRSVTKVTITPKNVLTSAHNHSGRRSVSRRRPR